MNIFVVRGNRLVLWGTESAGSIVVLQELCRSYTYILVLRLNYSTVPGTSIAQQRRHTWFLDTDTISKRSQAIPLVFTCPVVISQVTAPAQWDCFERNCVLYSLCLFYFSSFILGAERTQHICSPSADFDDICHSYSKRMVSFIALNNSEVILDYPN